MAMHGARRGGMKVREEKKKKKTTTADHFISLHTFLWVPAGFSSPGSFSKGPRSFMVPGEFLQGLTDAVRLLT